MQYEAEMKIKVDGAEAPDMDYVMGKAAEIAAYLGFEGEEVSVEVSIPDGVEA